MSEPAPKYLFKAIFGTRHPLKPKDRGVSSAAAEKRAEGTALKT
jgi:hypothetical protein